MLQDRRAQIGNIPSDLEASEATATDPPPGTAIILAPSDEILAEVLLENRLLKKKRDRRWGIRYMRYRAAEKLEIIRLVEQSSLPVRRMLAQLGELHQARDLSPHHFR